MQERHAFKYVFLEMNCLPMGSADDHFADDNNLIPSSSLFQGEHCSARGTDPEMITTACGSIILLFLLTIILTMEVKPSDQSSVDGFFCIDDHKIIQA